MNILTALKTTLTAFPQVERRIALAQFLSRYINSKVRITNYRCIGKDADVIDAFLRNVGMDESVYTIIRSKFDNDTALIKWNTTNQEQIISFTKNVSQAITVNSLTHLYSGIVIEPNEESVARDDINTESLDEHWSKNIQEVTENILGDGVHVHFATLGEIERYAWKNNLIDHSVKLPPKPLFFPKKDHYAGLDVAVRYMKDIDGLGFMPGLTSAPLRSLLASTSDKNPLVNFLYQTKDDLSRVNDLATRGHLLVTTTGWVNTMERLHTMQLIEFISNSKDLWAYISMLYRVVYKVHCTVTPWSRVAVNNIRTQSPGIYPTKLRENNGWGEIRTDVDNIGSSNHLAVFVSVILTPHSTDGNTPVPGYTNVQDVTPVPLVPVEASRPVGGEDEAIVSRVYLDKRDLGGEWFATVHGLDMNDVTGTPEERIENFRTMYSELNPADYTKVPLMYGLGSSNPVQVFTSGCAIAIRDFFQRVNRIPKFHNGAESIITDIYSGIITDGSTTIDSYSRGAQATFPDIKRAERTSSVSAFFDSLDTEEGSAVQLRVAPRTDVATSRLYSIILKTTLDADSFLLAWQGSPSSIRAMVKETIGMSFLNAYVYKGQDPTAVAGLATPPTTHTVQMLKDLFCKFDLPYPCVDAEPALTRSKVLTPERLLDFYSNENLSVAKETSICFQFDSENRLYIALALPLSFAVTARLVYRASNGLPIATRTLAQKLQSIHSTGSSEFTAYAPESEQDHYVYFDKYIAAIMNAKAFRGQGKALSMDYPANNIEPIPETSVLMDAWSTMYFKRFLLENGLNTYPGPCRDYLSKEGFGDIAGDDEFNKSIRVKDVVFGTSEN